MSVEEQLLEEIARHQGAIRDFGSDGSNGAILFKAQFESRIQELEQQLEAIRQRQLEVVLNTGMGEEGYAVPAGLLAGVVGRLQQSLTWGAHAFRFGPGVQKEPPVAIRRGTEVDVLAFAASSFKVVVRRPLPADPRQEQIQVSEEGLFDRAVESVLELARAAEAGVYGEDVETLAQTLGPKASRYIQWLMKDLASSGATTQIVWRIPTPESVTLTAEQARGLSGWLAAMEASTETLSAEGVLRMADADSGRFKLEKDDGLVFEGKAVPELVSGKTIDARYRAEMSVTSTVRDHVGGRSERYVLLSLDSIPDE